MLMKMTLINYIYQLDNMKIYYNNLQKNLKQGKQLKINQQYN